MLVPRVREICMENLFKDIEKSGDHSYVVIIQSIAYPSWPKRWANRLTHSDHRFAHLGPYKKAYRTV